MNAFSVFLQAVEAKAAGGSVFPPSLWAQYEADSFSQIDGSNITTNWADKSGNGRTAVLSGSPTFEANERGSLPIIRFGGDSNDYFTLPSMSALSAGHFFAVLKLNDKTTNGGFHFDGGGTASHYPYGTTDIYDGFGATDRKGPFASGVDFLSWHLLEIHSAPGDWAMRQNGSVIQSLTANTVAFPGNPYLGYNTGQFMRMDLAGVYLFSQKLSSTDAAVVRNYCQTKWSL